MQKNKVDIDPDSNIAFEFERPVLRIRRWNRCLWILIVTLAWTCLMLGFMIPGAVGMAQGENSDDILLYVGLISFIFAGLFFTFWYICQYETNDITHFERHVTKRVKRVDDGPRHSRPKSLRSPVTRSDSNRNDDDMKPTSQGPEIMF